MASHKYGPNDWPVLEKLVFRLLLCLGLTAGQFVNRS